MKIVVLPGDGIGPETMSVTIDILNAVSTQFNLQLELQHDIAGHESLKQYGATVTEALLEKVKHADGLMLGPMATYDFKDEAKGEINPSMFSEKTGPLCQHSPLTHLRGCEVHHQQFRPHCGARKHRRLLCRSQHGRRQWRNIGHRRCGYFDAPHYLQMLRTHCTQRV